MEDGVNLASHQVEPLAPEQGLRLIAPVGKKSRRASRDRTLTNRGRF
jgi:hypothetical protein